MIGIGLDISASTLGEAGTVSPQPSFIALLDAEGQSNIVGFNSIDSLPASARRLYGDVSQLSITAGAGTSTPTVETLPYVLAAADETIAGQEGRYGERCLTSGGGSGGTGPTIGLAAAFDTGTLWGTASALLLAKAATAGQHIDAFRPSLSGQVWQNKIHGRRHLRQALAGLPAPLRYQAKIWWQGETNTSTPRAEANLTHPDITDYAQHFEEIYAFEEAQMGAQPPWFLIALSPIETSLGSGQPDPYTAAINDQLRGLCRWHIAQDGTITDAANGGHTRRYFVEHGLRNGNNVHLTASQMQQLGQLIANALVDLRGADGASHSYAPALRPVITQLAETEISDADLTLSLRSTDGGTLYVAALPAGDPAPTQAKLKAGTGFLATQQEALPSTLPPGGQSTVLLSALPQDTPMDIYALLTTDEINSPLQSLPDITLPSSASVWDVTYQPSLFSYSENGALVNNGETGTRYARGTQTRATGKFIFEVDVFGSVVFVGVGDQDAPLGGGTNGVRKAGWLGTTLRFSGGGLQQMGSHINSQTTVQVAVDLTARQLWLRPSGATLWNNTADADPASGTSGADISAVLGPLKPLAGLGPGTTTGARLRTSGLTLPLPTGFQPWG
ncbi:hypothetical protein J7400_13185 [Shimia sp. R9_2]|uniref:hypothetical protein n=1 Tax=Shimia sp. R9_2 TaxID=2821112 RepID=UPI001ADACBBF|nr:hypothetical protein [Shimia sp. R9_2]MBO9397635.1 hypothetical protein [Shimia sp. R9_2]